MGCAALLARTGSYACTEVRYGSTSKAVETRMKSFPTTTFGPSAPLGVPMSALGSIVLKNDFECQREQH
jgi:hypothetical protein